MRAPGLAHSAVLLNVLGFSSVVAIVVGVRMQRPQGRLAWYLLALGLALFVGGDVLAYNYTRIFHHAQPFPSVADILYLAVYPSLVLGLLRLIRRRNPGGDRASLLDAMIITLGAGLVSWVYLMAPIAQNSDLSLLTKLTAIAYPLMDLALLAVLVRLAVGSGSRVLSFRFLMLGAGALLLTDSIYAWINLHGVYTPGGPLDLGWVAFYFLWGAAALHPSVRELDRSAAPVQAARVRRRIALLALASLLGPAVETVQWLTGGEPEALVVAVCTAAMFVLVLVRLYGAMVDVGEYRKAERIARQAERKFRSLVEDLPGIVYVTDATSDPQWRYVSPQIEQILGYQPEELIVESTLWERLLHPDDRERTLAARREAIALGSRLRCEYRITGRDGREVWIRQEGSSIPGELDGEVVRQGVLYDITDIKRAEEALVGALTKERDAAAHLRALDAMKTSILQAVSHDLRTPLTTILGSALTLERDDIELSPEDTHDLAARIAANARRLNRLLTNLLDMDRISRGIVEPNRQLADMRGVAGAALEGLALDGRELRLDVVPVRADVDAAQIERILENLVVNAIRYAPANEPIDVTIEPSDAGLLIRVDDRGPGVPEALRTAIFEPFRQGSATLQHSPGTGIGLSLVARFAELHGGRAWVEPRSGGGASFKVWLAARVERIDVANQASEGPVTAPDQAWRPVA